MRYRIAWINVKTGNRGAGPWHPETQKRDLIDIINFSRSGHDPVHLDFQYVLEESREPINETA